MSRWSNLSERAPARARLAVFLVPLLSACGAVGPPAFATSSELQDAPRRPDGVAIDPASATPDARDRAAAGDGMVTLRSPLGVELAMEMVGEFFTKVVLEDEDGLEALFTRDAIAVNGGGSGSMGAMGQTPSAALFWEQRFRKLDYGKLAGEVVYREAELEIYRADDVLEAPPHRAIRTDSLNDNDMVIRAPVVTARSGQERLFGEEIVFWLRRDGERYRIFRILEDFQIP